MTQNSPSPAEKETPSYDRTLDFAALIGSKMLANTAAASEVVQAIVKITDHDGLKGVNADVAYNQVVITYRDSSRQPVVWLEPIPERTFNFGAYTELARILDDYLEDKITIEQATERTRQAPIGRPRYPVWMTRPLCGVAGLLVAVVFGAGWVAAAVAFVANILVDWMFGFLTRRNWPTFFLQILIGLIAAFSAAIVTAIDARADGSQVVVAVIMLMLAGMTSTGAVQDLLTGWYVTGIGRLFEGFLNTVGLIVGVQLGIHILSVFDVQLAIGPDVAFAPHPMWLMLIMGALVAISFSLVSQLGPSTLPINALLTCGTWLAYDRALDFGFDIVWAAGIGALVAGLVSPLFAWIMRVPAANMASIAIILLFPGLLIYRGLLEWSNDFNSGFYILFQAFGTAIALAIGVMFGQYLTAQLLHLLMRFIKVKLTFIPHLLRPFRNKEEQSAQEQSHSALETSPPPSEKSP